MFASEIGNLPNSGATEDASLALHANIRKASKGKHPILFCPMVIYKEKDF